MKKRIGITFLIVLALLAGYKFGVYHATTAAGHLENNSFILTVDGNDYEWIVNKTFTD